MIVNLDCYIYTHRGAHNTLHIHARIYTQHAFKLNVEVTVNNGAEKSLKCQLTYMQIS